MDVCVPLQDMLGSSSDVARQAIDTVLHLAVLIPAKVFRALTGLPAGGSGEEDWDAARLDDANGSAKVVRLAIAESREAWAALADLPAFAGVPARRAVGDRRDSASSEVRRDRRAADRGKSADPRLAC